MAIFNSYVTNYQRVSAFWIFISFFTLGGCQLVQSERLQPTGRPYSIGVWSHFQLLDWTEHSTVFRQTVAYSDSD